jgi:hypothetical protein
MCQPSSLFGCRAGSLRSHMTRHRETKNTIIASVQRTSQIHLAGPLEAKVAIMPTSHIAMQTNWTVVSKRALFTRSA